MFWPREKIYLYMILPVEAWLLVVLAIGASLYFGMSGSSSGTAHFAHLGGLGFAFAYLKWSEYHRGASRRAFQKAVTPGPQPVLGSDRGATARWQGISLEGLHEINREEIERLL